MTFSTAIRTVSSYAAFFSSAFCLWQVPGVWERQRDGLHIRADAWQDLLREHLVVVDPGHGGKDGGTQGHGVLEKNCALQIAKRVEKQILVLGPRTLMTRRDDTFVELEERSAIANRNNADLFVSIHLNADATSGETSGLETYFSSRKRLGDLGRLRGRLELPPDRTFKDKRSERLARNVQREACATTGAADRNARDSNYLVVMQSECPAVLVECGYLTNEAEAKRLQDAGYQEKLAAAIARSVKDFLLASTINPRRGIAFDSITEGVPTGALREGNP